ncbi:MAG: histidine kinase dimerization/phospho-acceptor domain-containing protein, partial [Thermodesulfobacteriota bacterium]
LGLSLVYFIGNRSIERVIGANFKELAFETSARVDNYIQHHLEEVHFLSITPQIIDHVRERNSRYTGKDFPKIQEEIEKIDSLWDEAISSGPISLYPGKDSSEIQKDIEAIWKKNPAKKILSDLLNNKASKFMKLFERVDAEEESGTVHINILITDKKGVAIAATNTPDRFYYGGEKRWKYTYNDGNGQKHISDINLDRRKKIHTFDIGMPIIDQGETIGTVLMRHYVENFFKSVTSVKVGKTDHTMLASSDGTLLFCPIFPIKSHILKKELSQAIFQGEAGWSITNADVHFSGRSINGFAPVKMSLTSGSHSFGGKIWYVFTSQDPKETYAPINTLLMWIAASGLFGIVLLGLLVVYASRMIVKPIKMLHDGAELIGKGDLNYRLQIKSGDEIEELADKFNEMVEQLKSSYTDLEKKVEERTEELLKTHNDLAILFDITATVSKSLNMDEILSEVLKKILSAIGGGAGFICLLDEESGKLLMAAHEGLTPDLIKKNKSIKVDTYPYSRVVREGRPYISEDLSRDKKYKRSYISNKYSSLACIPLRSKNEVLGSFTIYSAEAGIFSKVANLLESIGNQLGISIENAKLFSEAEKFSRMKSEFVSHVSHELRTPLSSIKSAAEILLDYGETDEKVQREFLDVINSEADRLTRLVNDTLDLSKIESGRVKWNFELLDMRDI